MQTNQLAVGSIEELGKSTPAAADLLLVFGGVGHFGESNLASTLREAFPGALALGCSTAGEISHKGVDDDSIKVSAIRFEKTRVRGATTALDDMGDSFAAGQRIGQQLAGDDLKAILLFAPGVQVNGSALLEGIVSVAGQEIPIVGGMAGDGGAFKQTFTIGPDGVAANKVAAAGLYGDSLRFGYASFGGWQPFGPARKVTRCADNILYELDGEPALEIYKRYLGEHADKLPASGLLFPFAMLNEDSSEVGLIRTILGIDEAEGSLILAGDINPDGYLRLMHANTDKLVDGAEVAAENAAAMLADAPGMLAMLVSCVGRKLVMGDRVDEEVEAVSDVLGAKVALTGFYSYGEFCPFSTATACKLHNQTMAVTCIGEA